MNAHLARQIDRARIDARSRRHDAAAPEHLLAVVLDEPRLASSLRDRGLDPLELRDRLDARFAEIPAIGGYRDGGDAPLSPAFERIVARVATRGWLDRITKKTTVLDALLVEPAIAALVLALRRGNDYRHILSRAVALAIVSGHDAVRIGHLFRVLLDLRSFVDTVSRAGGDVELLRSAIEGTLTKTAAEIAPAASPTLDREVSRVVALAKAMARRSSVDIPTIRQLCLELARHEEAEPLWSTAGIDASAFVRAVHVPDAEALRARGLLR